MKLRYSSYIQFTQIIPLRDMVPGEEGIIKKWYIHDQYVNRKVYLILNSADNRRLVCEDNPAEYWENLLGLEEMNSRHGEELFLIEVER